MKTIATVAMPEEVGLLFTGAGVVLLTTLTTTKQQDIKIADIQSVGFRFHLSEKNRMYVPTIINFSAPKRPVIKRSCEPPPTSVSKNCGPKYASAVIPVHCCPKKRPKARASLYLFAGSRSSFLRKPALVRNSNAIPVLISSNSALTSGPSSALSQVKLSHASSTRPFLTSQRTLSGKYSRPAPKVKGGTSCKPTGICHCCGLSGKPTYVP